MKKISKKIISVLLSVLMIIPVFAVTSSAAFRNHDVRPAGTQVTDFSMLKNHAKTNSYANKGNDRGIEYAFDGIIKDSSKPMWHQNYNGANGSGYQNPPDSNNKIYLQTGFNEPKKITGLVYYMRWDKDAGEDSCGIPENYRVLVSDDPEFSTYEVAGQGRMFRWSVSPISFSKGYVEGKYVRLEVSNTYGGRHMACSELEVYEMADEKPITDYNMLKANANSNSSALNGDDANADRAFDGNTDNWNRWHQNYENKGYGPSDRPSDGNRIWLQTGFNEPRTITSVAYLSRVDKGWNDSQCGIPKRYQVLVSDDVNFGTYKVAAEGILPRSTNNKITFAEPQTCRYVRFVNIELHSHFAACTEMTVYEKTPFMLIKDFDMLQRNASASSSYGGHNGSDDGKVEKAFDGRVENYNRWHQNYDWGLGGTWNPSTGKGGPADYPEWNRPLIWIQTGFDDLRIIGKLRFTGRMDVGVDSDSCGIPREYRIEVSNSGNGPFREIKRGNMDRVYQTDIVFDNPVECKYIRFIFGPTHKGYAACTEIQLFEVPRYNINLEKNISGGKLEASAGGQVIIREAEGKTVSLSSGNPDPSYYRFDKWEVLSPSSLNINNINSENGASFTMPGTEVRIRARYSHYHTGTYIPQVYATCTSEGTKAYYECACGKYFEDAACTAEIADINTWKVVPVNPSAHLYEVIPAVEPTCTTPGRNSYLHCTLCGNYYKNPNGTGQTTPEDEVINPLPHNYGDWVITAQPTCTETGSRQRVCADCGYTDIEVLAMLPHSTVKVEAAPATCRDYGTSEHYLCTVCGKRFSDFEGLHEVDPADVLSPLDPDNHVGGTVIKNKKDATCSSDGYTGDICCAGCGEVLTPGEVIPQTGHIFGDWTDNGNGTHSRTCIYGCGETETAAHKPAEGKTTNILNSPSCTRSGTYEEITVCEDCGRIISREVKTIPATGHNFVLSETVAPTCSKGGYDIYVCTYDERHTEIRNRTAPTGLHTEVTVEGKPATCTEDGCTESSYCSVCGSVIKPEMIIPALGHDIVILPAVSPTCTEPGLTEGCYCRNCDYSVPQTEIPAAGHKFEEYPGKAPTCTEPGRTSGLICKVCRTVINSTPVEALGHNYIAESFEPTCTEAGYTVYTCANDPSHTYTVEGEPAYGHIGGKATCQSPAICARCGKAYGEKGDHSYIATVIPPTCVHEGYTEYTCEYCGKTYRDSLQDKVPHEFDEGIVTVVPTCTKDGMRIFTCKNCGETFSETIKAEGHKVDKWEVIGTKAYGTCTVCGEQLICTPEEAGVEIPVCERCGMRHIYEYGIFKYKGIYCNIVYFFRQIAAFFSRF